MPGNLLCASTRIRQQCPSTFSVRNRFRHAPSRSQHAPAGSIACRASPNTQANVQALGEAAARMHAANRRIAENLTPQFSLGSINNRLLLSNEPLPYAEKP